VLTRTELTQCEMTSAPAWTSDGPSVVPWMTLGRSNRDVQFAAQFQATARTGWRRVPCHPAELSVRTSGPDSRGTLVPLAGRDPPARSHFDCVVARGGRMPARRIGPCGRSMAHRRQARRRRPVSGGLWPPHLLVCATRTRTRKSRSPRLTAAGSAMTPTLGSVFRVASSRA
jgi:hypothetical protein